MITDNLKQFEVPDEIAQKSELLGKYIVSKGYFLLNEENAKLYGDAFSRASRRLQFQNDPIQMTGMGYIENFENIPMEILETDNQDYKYTILPSEIKEQKNGFLKKLWKFLKNKIKRREIPALGSGYPTQKKKKIEGIQLDETTLNAYNQEIQGAIKQLNTERPSTTILESNEVGE